MHVIYCKFGVNIDLKWGKEQNLSFRMQLTTTFSSCSGLSEIAIQSLRLTEKRD